MGVESKHSLPLPAPTETTESNAPSEAVSDFSTDVSSSQDDDEKSSYSLPDDGTPVTIKTRGYKHTKSQTSLLIEYFEGGKSGDNSTERKPSVRVRLTPSSKISEDDHLQITKAKNSQVDQSHRRRNRRPASPLIPTPGQEGRVSGYQSEISAIPSDSFLDGSTGKDGRGSSYFNFSTENMPSKPSSGKDRASAHKSRDRDRERKHKSTNSKSRSSSVSERPRDEVKSSRRSSRVGQTESNISAFSSGLESSLLSASQVSASQNSKVSGTSRASGSSINNPKLLETVEDAIRRLILPELNAIKREQSVKRSPRPESLTTASSITNTSCNSRDDRSERRRSTKSSETRRHESRNREARNDLDAASFRDADEDSIDMRLEDYGSPFRSSDKFKVAGASVTGAPSALTASSIDQSPSDISTKRRRKRSEKKLGAKSTDDVFKENANGLAPPVPPMPLSSEINPSEVTRASILSADTDRPHSATEELTPVQESSLGTASVDSTLTPVRTPTNVLEHIGVSHANISHGDLKDLPSRRTGEFPRGIELPPDEEEYDEEEEFQNGYPGYYDQDVPAPLNYVPYQPAARGLSPIESVSGFTDGLSEVQQQRDSRHVQTPGSFLPDKPEEGISNISAPSNVRGHGFEESELGSIQSSVADGYRKSGAYTTDSELDQVQSGQAVQQVGANPKFINNPIGVESNVASLVEGSVIEPSLLSASYNHPQRYASEESITSHETQSSRPRSAADSRGISPGSPSVASRRQFFEDRMESPSSRKSHLSREFPQEYELDAYGRKVPMATKTYHEIESPTPSEEAITGAAVGIAAAALKAAREKNLEGNVARNKSFKERANTTQPAATPKHSVDRFSWEGSPKMGATAIPDSSMPEIGYGIDDQSMVDDQLESEMAGDYAQDRHSGHVTPTQRNADSAAGYMDLDTTPTRGPDGPVAMISHSREPSEEHSEDFRRSSHDHKRDTIITNPYENSSPVPILPGADQQMLEDAIVGQYGPPSFPIGTPGLQQKVDEGYISQGPNRTPDAVAVANRKGVDLMDHGQHPGPTGSPFEGHKGHARHLSGMSQGMTSPLYDASTGNGIDRIENKDIVALMQHLMVRDAQRSARDTEILVTLVRTAADMRNSFDAVTRLLGDVENTIITEVQENTDKTVRTHLGGPRPYPGSVAARSVLNGSQAGTDELAAKKANIFRRALKGLSAKGSNDLGRIEDMLNQLLSEVDVLKAQTAGPATRAAPQEPSFDTLQPAVQYEQDRGYEPSGFAGTSTASHGSQSGHLSLPQRGPSAKLAYDGNRISTVHEDENEYEMDPPRTPQQEDFGHSDLLMSGARGTPGQSSPLDTPQSVIPPVGSTSQENTPKEKSKKQKSGDSKSWFPKVSRWSETTASSIGNKFRMSGSSKKNQSGDLTQAPPTRSGSRLGDYDIDGFLRSDPSGDDQAHMQSDHLDSGLMPPTMQPPHPSTYMTPEDPKYHAHRNSLNLQHPQPRQGNTEKYKLALETSAQNFEPQPLSPRSGNWAGSVSSSNRLVGEPNEYSEDIHEGQQYWTSSSPAAGGPPRPPKESMEYDSRDSPAQGSRISRSQPETSPLPFHSVESGYGTATTGAGYVSPRLENKNLNAARGIPARRPSGPRAMTPKNTGRDVSPDERRKRDTFGTMMSQESETF